MCVATVCDAKDMQIIPGSREGRVPRGLIRSRVIAIGATLWITSSCASPAPVTLPAPEQVALLRVNRREDGKMVEVSSTRRADEIKSALDVLSRRNEEWSRPGWTSREPEYVVSFHSGAGSLLVIYWIGADWLAADTLAELPLLRRERVLDPGERAAILQALGVSAGGG